MRRELTIDQRAALQSVGKFRTGSGNGVFPNCNRAVVADGLAERVVNPGVMQQGPAGICGAATFLFTLAETRVRDYVKYVIDVYTTGRATIGELTIEPSAGFRRDSPPPVYLMPTVDFVAMGSLRDSANWLFEYHLDEAPFVHLKLDSNTVENLRGFSVPGDIETWFKKAGFTNVVKRASTVFTQSWANAEEASRRYLADERVCLLIHHNMMGYDTLAESSTFPSHWVALTSEIKVVPHEVVKFTVFSWGNRKTPVPDPAKGGAARSLTKERFLQNYYGFVSADG